MDLGVLPTSTAPMDRNTENPRFFKDSEGKKRISNFHYFRGFMGVYNSGVSNGKFGLDVLVSNSANTIWYLH